MHKSITELIDWVEVEYRNALSEYENKCILLERHDDKFLDSDNNIFTYEQHSILMGLIDRYRAIKNQRHNRNYEDVKDQLLILKKDVNEYFINVYHRMMQIDMGEAYEKLSSERYFINDFQNRLDLTIKLICNCLIPFEKYVNQCEEDGSDLCEDEDYTLFLVNKCLILNHTSLFNDECVRILNKITKKLEGRKAYSSALLFRVGTLNMQHRLYDNAEVIFKQLITKLYHKVANEANVNEKYMYFSAYIMLISSYEYSGKYDKALLTLIGGTSANDSLKICNELINKITSAIRSEVNSIDALCFVSNDKVKREKIVQILRETIVYRNPFDSEIAKFAYDNGEVFLELTKKENCRQRDNINKLYKEKNEDRTDVINRVCEKYSETEEKNKPLHDFLHLLAHCINEEAVLVIYRQYPAEEELYHKLIILARAIMLLVSEDEETYKGAHSFKTCFATVYAETGEFHLASRSISEIVMNPQYSKMDVTSKAEIDFFYYLLPRIDSISNGNLINYSIEGDQHYNHYLNCCYRKFDFDAISHISLLSFEYQIAVMLQNGDLASIAKEFNSHTNKSGDGSLEAKYRHVINIRNLDVHNIWLRNERNKVKYIFQFLKLYFASNDKGKTVRSPRIYEVAYQYLKISKSYGQDPESVKSLYIDFDDVENAIQVMQELFGEVKRENHSLAIDNIKLVISDYAEEPVEFDSMSAYFVFNTQKKQSYLEDDPEFARIRFFDSQSAALKEFFLMSTLMKIKEDFINPSRIFIMTPINNAEPCKFLVTDDYNLIHQNYESSIDSEYDFNDVNTQYSLSLIRPSKLSKDWLTRLNYASRDWVWALTFAIKNDKSRNTQYTVYYPDKQPISSIIYNCERCKNKLNSLYKNFNIRHGGNCGSLRKCHVWRINKIDKPDVKQLFASFPEIAWVEDIRKYGNGELLLWKSEQDQTVIWRIVFIKSDQCIDSTMMALCNYGQEVPFEKRKKEILQEWPAPYDIFNGTKPFVFICHLGKEDNFVREELNSFFESGGVRYWYDHEMILGEDWLKKVKNVINKNNCVGCIMLVTKQEFFESVSINREFAELAEKKRKNPDFSIVPVIYNCYGESELNEMVRRAYGQGSYLHQESYKICIDLIGIGHSEFLKVYLNDVKGNTLQEYRMNELDDGRKSGAILELCKTLNVIKEEL